MSQITPTIGRKVWFFPALTEGRGVPDQPLDATICYVNDNGNVNLACHDQIGQSFPSLNVPLFAPDAPEADAAQAAGKSYATWMPYQQQQAAKYEKQEQLEATNGLISVADATEAAAALTASEAPAEDPAEAPTAAPTSASAPAPAEKP